MPRGGAACLDIPGSKEVNNDQLISVLSQQGVEVFIRLRVMGHGVQGWREGWRCCGGYLSAGEASVWKMGSRRGSASVLQYETEQEAHTSGIKVTQCMIHGMIIAYGGERLVPCDIPGYDTYFRFSLMIEFLGDVVDFTEFSGYS